MGTNLDSVPVLNVDSKDKNDKQNGEDKNRNLNESPNRVETCIYCQDNFDFSLFKKHGVKWDSPETFGEKGSYVVPTKQPPKKHIWFESAGINGDNFYHVDIKGDGSCWIRSSIQAILYPIFHREDQYSFFIQQISNAEKIFFNVPGFTDRFKAKKLIKLIKFLKSEPPNKRLEHFNKSHVDLFLDWNFRALLHAIDYYNSIIKRNLDPIEAKKLSKLLKDKSQDDSSHANSGLHFYLLNNFNYAYFTGEAAGLNSGGITWRGGKINWKTNEGKEFHKTFWRHNIEEHLINNILWSRTKPLSFAELEEIQSETYDYREAVVYEDILFFREILGLKKFADMHASFGLSVMSYREYAGHTALMIHKNALFGQQF
jgi:hypothetical protein